MAKDTRFCFTFYPGDYLRDTQCLSEGAQVAYDRIMCEHMRNICVSQQQLKFFTKKLSEDEKEELLTVLTKSDDGYMISWVVDSIVKKQAYSESRAENRKGKKKEHVKKTSKSYVPHMEDEIEKEYVINIDFNSFWSAYDKKVGDKAKLRLKWDSLTDTERFKAMEHIPLYIASQPDKRFRKDPATYLNNKSFNDEIIQSNGQQPITTPGGQNAGGEKLGTSAARIEALKNW